MRALLALLCVSGLAHASDEDPECRGRCAAAYQTCTRVCKPAPGEPYDSRKINACGDRCIQEAGKCNRKCGGK